MAKAQSLTETPKARFDKMAEGKKKPDTQEDVRLLAIRVPKSWPKKLRLYTIEHDTSIQAMLNELIEKEMKRLGIL